MSFWEGFWDIIWWFFWAFVFISYLFALFAIISDLVRDRTLNGWWKALWVVFLVFVPFLTSLVYLIARGNGMAERSAEARRATTAAEEHYIRAVTGVSPSDEIAKAKSLLDGNIITVDEYDRIKSHALAGVPASSSSNKGS